MLIQAFGFGLGVGIVHTAVLSLVLFLARSSERNREEETLGLMRERNSIDREKVAALQLIARMMSGDPDPLLRRREVK